MGSESAHFAEYLKNIVEVDTPLMQVYFQRNFIVLRERQIVLLREQKIGISELVRALARLLEAYAMTARIGIDILLVRRVPRIVPWTASVALVIATSTGTALLGHACDFHLQLLQVAQTGKTVVIEL